MVHSLRSLGSTALNFAMVAQGGLDICWCVVSLLPPFAVSFRISWDWTNIFFREIGCWAWDVCAGIVIAQEAGGVVTGSHEAFASSSSSSSFGDMTEDILTGRKYIVVRAVGDGNVSSFYILLLV
jgi:myo-inositol-1(or 4)-monophosphatase